MKRVLVFLTLFPLFLFAHKVNLFGYYENKILHLESFFANSNACIECEFKIYQNEKEVFKDKLNGDGKFEKELNLSEPFEVVVDAGVGHQARVLISKNQDNIEIQKNVEKNQSYLDKIVCGIGYIFGIFGILILIKNRGRVYV